MSHFDSTSITSDVIPIAEAHTRMLDSLQNMLYLRTQFRGDYGTDHDMQASFLDCLMVNGMPTDPDKVDITALLETQQTPLSSIKFYREQKKKVIYNAVTQTIADHTIHLVTDEERKPEVKLNVAIYHASKTNLTKMQEFEVMGSHTLVSLRDSIGCITDMIHEEENKMATQAAYFFIESVFYYDKRNADTQPYDPPWAPHRNYIGEVFLSNQDSKFHIDLKCTKAGDMSQTTFKDLAIKFNHAYLYSHCGHCEHFMIFSDISLQSNADLMIDISVPLKVFQSYSIRAKCQICDIYPATKLTYQDKYAPYNPCRFCNICYRDLHKIEVGVEDSDGNVVSQWRNRYTSDDTREYKIFHETPLHVAKD